jgi:hypothetical protein
MNQLLQQHVNPIDGTLFVIASFTVGVLLIMAALHAYANYLKKKEDKQAQLQANG